jgi:hypothetical protein
MSMTSEPGANSQMLLFPLKIAHATDVGSSKYRIGGAAQLLCVFESGFAQVPTLDQCLLSAARARARIRTFP